MHPVIHSALMSVSRLWGTNDEYATTREYSWEYSVNGKLVHSYVFILKGHSRDLVLHSIKSGCKKRMIQITATEAALSQLLVKCMSQSLKTLNPIFPKMHLESIFARPSLPYKLPRSPNLSAPVCNARFLFEILNLSDLCPCAFMSV